MLTCAHFVPNHFEAIPNTVRRECCHKPKNLLISVLYLRHYLGSTQQRILPRDDVQGAYAFVFKGITLGLNL